VGCTIVFAWLGWGVWALVLGSLAGALVRTAALWIAVPYRPRLRFHFPLLRRRLRTGFSFLGSAVVGYMNNNLDYLVVGRRFGATELGYYQAAYSLSDELRNRLSLPLQRVLFPAYSLVQDDLGRFRNGVLTAARLLSVAVFPLAAGISATASEVVALLYGPRWMAVVPLLQILAVNGAIRSVLSMVGAIFAARDKMHVSLLLSLNGLVVTGIALFIGMHWGVRGVAIAMLCATANGVLSAHIALRYLGLNLLHLARAVGPAAAGAAIMAGALLLVRPHLADADIGLPSRAIALTLIGAVLYGCSLALLSPQTLRLCLSTLRRLR
jgi:PST family polysaccharide transporter